MVASTVTPEWIDAGARSAEELHALYTGLAASTAPDAPPRILWVHAHEPHISIGASQDAESDLDLAACAEQGVPVVRRPLGGGSVWVDADQACFFLIQPRQVLARGHRHLFAVGLGIAMDVLRALGLEGVEARGQDVWVQGRKIMGTGAATLDEGCVFGASFLRHFPVERFLACVYAPSEGYRDWLRPALETGMTDCARQCPQVPAPAQVEAALQDVLARRFGIPARRIEPDRAILDQWLALGREELTDLADGQGSPSVRDGIRVNRDNHVFETRGACGRLRLHVEGSHIARIWCEDAATTAILEERLVGESPERLRVRSRLNGQLDARMVDEISARIDGLYRGIAAA
ncbi:MULTISPECIES: lipoate--protein ligase family protein [unclassified Thioalkalivibrio]|uniref:lipoate--protein ligase family protein n=1 Tax=unclassified Thioalkalivibrio TaxID=2621013 RepID=UPI0003820E19|nr:MULTISPECIES: lipoate--protein ligase family protein [unclassified Thioalkalivibrio]